MITLNASALPRVLACLGSTQFPQTEEVEQSESAREGTAAHFIAETAIVRDVLYPEHEAGEYPKEAPNGYAVDAEMIEHAKAYAATMPKRGNVRSLWIEESCDWYATSGIEIRVRLDGAWIADDTLYVRDYKYGWRLVEAEGNSQLVAGAVGILRKHFAEQSLFPPNRVNLGIYQPRPYHPDGPLRTWPLTLTELIAEHDALVADLAKLPSEALETGPHCEHCPGAVLGTCPAYLAAVGNAIDVATRGGPMEVTAAQMARELVTLDRAAAVLKQRKEWLEDIAKRKLKAGDVVPGWALEHRLGNTTWTVDAETLQRQTNVDILEKPKACTPAEAKRRGVDEELIKANTTRPKIGEKLVRRDPDAYVRKRVGKKKPTG